MQGQYALGLLPAQGSRARDKLVSMIERLRAEHDTDSFEPHVTLIVVSNASEAEVRWKTQQLTEKARPFQISLGELGSNGTYFQMLFAKALLSEELHQLNEQAQELFGKRELYFPHLSLVYGDLLPHDVELLKSLVENELGDPLSTEFEVTGIELWHTDAEVNHWRHLETYPFSR